MPSVPNICEAWKPGVNAALLREGAASWLTRALSFLGVSQLSIPSQADRFPHYS